MYVILLAGAWLSPLIVIIGAGIVGVDYYFGRRPEKGGLAAFGAFIFFLLASGTLGLFLGMGFALGVVCPLFNADPRGCTIGAIFVGGPLGFSVAAGSYFYIWGRREAWNR